MSGRTRRLLWGLAFGLAVIVGLMLYSDVGELTRSLETFDATVLMPVCSVVLLGYGIRTIKWEIYLRRLDIRLAPLESAWVFFSGLVMAISPMKVGEVLKSFLLKQHHKIPIARTAPIIVAERLTDVLALVLLASLGALSTGFGLAVVAVAAGLSALAIAVLASPRLSRFFLSLLGKLPFLRRFAHRFEEAYESMLRLIGPKTLVVTTLLSVLAWGGEGVACWWIVNGFEGVNAPLAEVVFIFSFATLAGALSMLPGGLLATEGSMIGLLHGVFHLMPNQSMATAATLITRFCTLWFAVVLGAAALLGYQRRHRTEGEA